MLGTASYLLDTKERCFTVQGSEKVFWVTILFRFITICTQNPLRAEVQLLLLFFLFWCWRVIVSLCRSAVTRFFNSIAKCFTHKWLSHWNTGLFFCWVGPKLRFLGRIAYFNTLFQITERDYWSTTESSELLKNPAVRIIVLVFAPVGSNARWTRTLTKVSALGSQLMCWYLIPIKNKELWLFPGSPRFSRSWTSVRLVFGVKCASDRRHKQTRLTAKTFLLLNGKSSFPWGLK